VSEKITKIDEIPLSGTKDGKISISKIDEPYGKNSNSVLSIGIFLDGTKSQPDWKIHIPKENIDSLIDALKKGKEYL
jgi:hypothetical protein